MMARLKVLLLVSLICVLIACDRKQDQDAVITVDCSETVGPLTGLTGYFNNSLRKAPPAELAPLVQQHFGVPEITRCWLTLDDMWDYRTDEYRYNFQIGKDYYPGDTVKNTYKSKNPMGLELESDILYEDYITSFSNHSKKLALNVRRYETEVLNGVITIEQWRQVLVNALLHYKKLCPNLVYIEVLNESGEPHFGGVEDAEYYIFFKAAWQAVNTVNDQLKPEMPLLVGGPSNHYAKDMRPFFKAYARDTDPNKRLDFITYHEYGAQDDPAKFARHEDEVQAVLRDFGLDEDLPQFITEMGYKGRTTEEWEDNFIQAAFVTSAIYHARNSENVTIFPWVLYHTYRLTSHVMYTDDLHLTPFGFAMKMLRMHADTEVLSSSDGLRPDGTGEGVLSSMKGGKIVVQLWNYSTEPFAGDVLIRNLPEELTGSELSIRKYVIDKEHNNNYQSPEKSNRMRHAEMSMKVDSDMMLQAEMQPMSLIFWEVSR